MESKKEHFFAKTAGSFGKIVHNFSLFIGTTFSTTVVWVGARALRVAFLGFRRSRAVLSLGESENFSAAIDGVAQYCPK